MKDAAKVIPLGVIDVDLEIPDVRKCEVSAIRAEGYDVVFPMTTRVREVYQVRKTTSDEQSFKMRTSSPRLTDRWLSSETSVMFTGRRGGQRRAGSVV